MDATTVKDDAALPPTVVESGHEADGSPDSRLSASLLEALDAIQPKAAAKSPDQGPGAGGAFDALSSGADEQITKVLKSWHQSYQNGGGNKSPCFYLLSNKSPCFYLLSNKPSGGRLSLSKLRGRARAVAERVAGICEKGQEFDVFLATLEKKTVSPPGNFSREDCRRWLEKEYEEDEDISDEQIDGQAGPEGHPDTGEVAEVKWSLKTIFDMSGGHAATDIPAQESEVVQSVAASFGERHFKEEPDEKQWAYQGNEEGEEDEFAPDAWTKMSVEFYYWRTVLVMVPSQETFKFLSSSSGFAFSGGRREFIEFQQWDPTRGLLRWYETMCLRHAKPTYIEAFNTLCKKLEDRRKLGAQTNASVTPRPAKPIKKPTNDEMMDALKIALICKKHESLDWILKNMKKDLTAEFIIWVKEKISPDDIPWLKLKTSICRILYHVERRGCTIRLREKYDMMNKLFTPAIPMSNELKSVAFSIVDESLEAVPRQRTGYEYGFTNDEARTEDASALFEMALCYRGFDYINTRVVPALARASTPFQVEFSRRLRQAIDRDEIPRADALTALRTLARSITHMDLTMTAGPYSEPEPDLPYFMSRPSRIPEARIVSPEALVDFVDSLLEFGFDEVLETFSLRLANAHGYIPVREYNALYIPLLRGLVKLFEKRNIPLLRYGLPTLFWRILNAYIWTFVGGEPKRDNWIRPRTECVCDACDEMNRFLQDPFVEVGKFMVNKELRNHLSVQLSHDKSDCETTELRTNYPANTLQVTKKLKNQEANMATWAENRAVAEKTIAAFDQGHLRLLLGTFYDDIVTMSKLSSSHEAYRAAGPPKYAPDHGKTPAGTGYRVTGVRYGGNSAYSRALLYTQQSPSVDATPAMSYPAPPPAVPLGPSSRGNIGPPLVTAPKPPMRPTDLPAPNLYPVYTETATRLPQPPLAPPYRAPLAEVSRNETEWEKVARLQDEIATAGGITPPSKKRKAAALAFGDENATVTQYNMPSSAGAKRRATEFIDLTSDGN